MAGPVLREDIGYGVQLGWAITSLVLFVVTAWFTWRGYRRKCGLT